MVSHGDGGFRLSGHGASEQVVTPLPSLAMRLITRQEVGSLGLLWELAYKEIMGWT